MALIPLCRYIYRSQSRNHNHNLNNLLASGTQSARNHSSNSMQACHNLKSFPVNLKPNVLQNVMFRLTAFEHRKSRNLTFQARFYNSISEEVAVTVSLTQVKKTLRLHGVSFEDGFTCLIADCPLCLDHGKNPSKLYINKFTGFFQCHQCHNSGSWATFERYLARKKSSKPAPQKELDKMKEGSLEELEALTEWKKLKKITEILTSIPEEEIISILNELKIPETSNVIGQFDVRVDANRSTLLFPLYNCDGQIVGYKILNIKSRRESTFPSMGCSGIISPKQGKNYKSDTAVLVPSLIDALSLATLKTSYQIICLPHGLTNLPQQVLPTLERFGKLVLWFGDEIDSWDTARNFAKKLGEKRCHFVRPVDEQSSAHAALIGSRDMRAILAAAQPIWHEAITEFASLREDVLAELQNNDKVQGVKWKRFPSLTRILKGHRRGEFTVLTGPTGSGKTTFMSEYSLDLALQGVNTLWGSFEIRNARLARTMLTQMAGLPLDKNLDQFDSYADQFEKLPIYFMTFHGQQSVKVVMEAVEHATYVHDIAHVIIDNVQFMMGVSEESKHMDRFWKQDAIIAHFRTFATKKNCHVSLVIHPRKERDAEDLTTNSIFGGAKAAQEADNVLIIQDKRLTSVRGKKYLQIAKNRYSGDLGVMPLDFDKDSISYGNRKKKTLEDGDAIS